MLKYFATGIGVLFLLHLFKFILFQKELEPERRIDSESSVVHRIPFVLLPGEPMQTFKVFRTFEDGGKEMLVYSIAFEEYDQGAYVEFSAQGRYGGQGDDHLVGANHPLAKQYTLPGTSSENRDVFFIKMRCHQTEDPVRGTIFLYGRNRYIFYPEKGENVPLRWE